MMSRHTHNHDESHNHDERPPRCLVTLEPLAEEGLSTSGHRALSGNKGQFPTRVDFTRQHIVQNHAEQQTHWSISGMQDKVLLRLYRGQLEVVNEQSTHILKPIPSRAFPMVEQIPANEHLTMRIAQQLGITTAACGLIRLGDGELAYITRRFDRTADQKKIAQEDFGSLACMTEPSHGKNWKYEYSYEEIGNLIHQHCSAPHIDIREFYRRVMACYLVGNGDAHVRNFSVLQTKDGFTQLSPAYDLLNTALHLPTESEMALSLLKDEQDGNYSNDYSKLGHYSCSDFVTLGKRLLIKDDVINKTLAHFHHAQESLIALIEKSFLDTETQLRYADIVRDRFIRFSRTFTPA